MSATNTTPNIGLPSFIGTDKPAWLTDWNGAMSTIDTEIGTIKTGVSGDETRIGNLENSVSSLNTTVSNHTTSITALNTQVATQGGTINTITSLIGNGTPTTTDQTIIGAINELHANQGDLANLVTTNKSSFVAAINEVAGGGGSIAASAVSYDNTTSGLTANNVQAAIDELAGAGPTPGQYDFDLSAHAGSYTPTAETGVTINTHDIHYAFNADYSIGKIYGIILCDFDRANYSNWATLFTLPSVGQTYAQAFNVAMGGEMFYEYDSSIGYTPNGPAQTRFHVNTDGSIEVQAKTLTTHTTKTVRFFMDLTPCIYFFENYGD